MITVICPACGAKLNAKDELEGQMRRCPKCQKPVIITAAWPEALTPSDVVDGNGRPGEPVGDGIGIEPSGDAPERLPNRTFLDRLDRRCLYLACDRSKVIAIWENNGLGWQLRTNTGLVSASRNQQLLPNQGTFRLVEVKIESTDEGTHLAGLVCYDLPSRWSLTYLSRGDDAVTAKIEGHAGLNLDQKNAVRNALKERFVRDIWHRAERVSAFLASGDQHSFEA